MCAGQAAVGKYGMFASPEYVDLNVVPVVGYPVGRGFGP